MRAGLARRDFLKGLGSLALARGALPGLAGPVLAGCGEDPLPGALATVYADAAAAAVVGRAYLERAPEEAEVQVLVDRIANDARAALRARASDRDGLLRALAERHAADFDAGRLVTVRGWLVSLTEARLCALAALAEPPTAELPPAELLPAEPPTAELPPAEPPAAEPQPAEPTLAKPPPAEEPAA
jgi:hypothetical protein